MHWHQNTFSLPDQAKLLASSEACAHQAFLYDRKVIGLQFHPEWSQEIIVQLASDDPAKSENPYEQSVEEILSGDFDRVKARFFSFLDKLAGIE